MSKRVPQKQGTGWPDPLTDLFNEGNANCDKSGLLKFTLYQTHGLIAKTSGRGKQHNLNIIPLQLTDQFPTRVLKQCLDMLSPDMPHKTVKLR